MVHPLILHNGELKRAEDPVVAAGQTGSISGWGVFSTLRVTGGVLFEWPRHFARMKKDAALMHVPFPERADEMEQDLLKLVDANRQPNCTLRVCVMRNLGGLWQGAGVSNPYDLLALTAPLNDWGESVQLALAPNARHAASKFVSAKILSWAQNLTYYEDAHDRGFDEVILLNERGEVAECTSANVFAVQGSDVFTPPVSSGCLPGVTRAVLLERIHVSGISIMEKVLTPPDLQHADSVFITSTTRDLLAVSRVEDWPMNDRGTVRATLLAAFQQYIRGYSRSAVHSATL